MVEFRELANDWVVQTNDDNHVDTDTKVVCASIGIMDVMWRFAGLKIWLFILLSNIETVRVIQITENILLDCFEEEIV